MTYATKPKGQSGFTIIEVLIAAVVFMIGFTIMVSLLNSTMLKFSTKELLAGSSVGRRVMLFAVSGSDTTSCDTVLDNSGFRFRVVRQTTIKNRLARVQVAVSRLKKTKAIVELYDEFVIPEK